MKRGKMAATVRRSVALPGELVRDAAAVAEPDLKDNLNRLVIVALREYVRRRREGEFDRAMADMAADPAIQSEMKMVLGL